MDRMIGPGRPGSSDGVRLPLHQQTTGGAGERRALTLRTGSETASNV